MDAYDRFWQWAEKPPDSLLTIPAELHHAVMALCLEDRRNREKVNTAAARAEILFHEFACEFAVYEFRADGNHWPTPQPLKR